MCIDGFRRSVPMRVPHRLDDVRSGSNCTGIFGEEDEEVEFLGRHREFTP